MEQKGVQQATQEGVIVQTLCCRKHHQPATPTSKEKRLWLAKTSWRAMVGKNPSRTKLTTSPRGEGRYDCLWVRPIDISCSHWGIRRYQSGSDDLQTVWKKGESWPQQKLLSVKLAVQTNIFGNERINRLARKRKHCAEDYKIKGFIILTAETPGEERTHPNCKNREAVRKGFEQVGTEYIEKEVAKAVRKNGRESRKPKRNGCTPIKPTRNTAYLKAVESGDTETAQRMVDEAAKKWGAYIIDGILTSFITQLTQNSPRLRRAKE